jgi:hypothetical protein
VPADPGGMSLGDQIIIATNFLDNVGFSDRTSRKHSTPDPAKIAGLAKQYTLRASCQ